MTRKRQPAPTTEDHTARLATIIITQPEGADQ